MGRGVPPTFLFFWVVMPTFCFIQVTFFPLVFQPMARDPFFSIKPDNLPFPFHSSLQAIRQAGKQARMSSNTYGYR